MKRHTKNIAAVALLALAGGAFLVDRFVLGYGPQAAAAAEPAADTPIAAARPAPTSTTSPNAAPSVSQRIGGLAGYLASVSGPPVLESSDAFVIPAVWHTDLAEPDPEKAAEKAGSGAIQVRPASAEQSSLALTAVIVGASNRSSAATINGTVVQVGDTFKGFTLLRVDGSSSPSAVLTGPDGEFTLHTKLDDAIRSALGRDGKPMFKPHRAD